MLQMKKLDLKEFIELYNCCTVDNVAEELHNTFRPSKGTDSGIYHAIEILASLKKDIPEVPIRYEVSISTTNNTDTQGNQSVFLSAYNRELTKTQNYKRYMNALNVLIAGQRINRPMISYEEYSSYENIPYGPRKKIEERFTVQEGFPMEVKPNTNIDYTLVSWTVYEIEAAEPIIGWGNSAKTEIYFQKVLLIPDL